MAVLGKVSMNLTADKLGSSGMKSEMEAKLPIVLKVAGIATQATLYVSLFIYSFFFYFFLIIDTNMFHRLFLDAKEINYVRV